MTYRCKPLIHDKKFDRDCEEIFGSLEKADRALADLLFCISHDLSNSSEVADGVLSFFNSSLQCVIVAEDLAQVGLVLRACISVRARVSFARSLVDAASRV